MGCNDPSSNNNQESNGDRITEPEPPSANNASEEPPQTQTLKPSLLGSVNKNLALLSATKRFDPDFKKYSKRFLPHIDWRYLKSLCWVESNFRPEAVSPVGAVGICQFMPDTFEQYKNLFNNNNASASNPSYNIKYAAAHVQFLLNFWSSPRPEEDRLKLSTASYNAGQGRLLQAQRLCRERHGTAVLYDDIIICLPDITGDQNSTETINHVLRTWRAWRTLVITGS